MKTIALVIASGASALFLSAGAAMSDGSAVPVASGSDAGNCSTTLALAEPTVPGTAARPVNRFRYDYSTAWQPPAIDRTRPVVAAASSGCAVSARSASLTID